MSGQETNDTMSKPKPVNGDAAGASNRDDDEDESDDDDIYEPPVWLLWFLYLSPK